MKLFKFYTKNKSYKFRSGRTPALYHNPQKRIVCIKPFLLTPKKPNSALRAVAKINVLSKRRILVAFIPGIGHTLHEFGLALMQGGKIQDLPAIRYNLIRGKLDLLGVRDRETSRSRYGKFKPKPILERPRKTLKVWGR